MLVIARPGTYRLVARMLERSPGTLPLSQDFGAVHQEQVVTHAQLGLSGRRRLEGLTDAA